MGQAKDRRWREAARAEELERLFGDMGVRRLEPGFYDDPAFLAVEREQPEILEDYAEWVLRRPRDAAYDTRVREVVPRMAEMLANHAISIGRARGACVDAAGAMMRMLERMGIWCFSVAGGFNVSVKGRQDLGTRYWWPYDSLEDGASVMGHMWTVAPPFMIVDCSVHSQPWEPEFARAMPKYVAEERPAKTRGTVNDLVSDDIRMAYAHRAGFADPGLHQRLQPGIARLWETFPSVMIETQHLLMRYVPTGISAPDCTLEELSVGEGGLHAGRLWRDVVAPAFDVPPG